MKQKYDLISIGDCAIDAFIKLHDASVHCDLNHRNCVLCISYADKVPYESLTVVPAVGNASNVAVGVSRLGLRSAAFTAVGNDHYGREILEVYRREKVGREFVKINKGAETNYHFVLTFLAERSILIKHQPYQYHDLGKLGDVEWIYFSSMAQNTLPFHQKLSRYLRKHPRTKMGFNPGTFQLRLGPKKLGEIYRRSHVLFVNFEEAQSILKNSPRASLSSRMTGSRSRVAKILFQGLHKLGPKIIAITDGPKGAYASDGKSQYLMPIYPDPKNPLERTGAGDAFSTGFMSALISGLPITEALRWAPVNAMNVVQSIGAQKGLLTKPELLRLLRRAPKHYYPKKI